MKMFLNCHKISRQKLSRVILFIYFQFYILLYLLHNPYPFYIPVIFIFKQIIFSLLFSLCDWVVRCQSFITELHRRNTLLRDLATTDDAVGSTRSFE